MDIFVKLFGSDEPPKMIADVDEEETIPVFKQKVAELFAVPPAQVRLIDDGDWGSLLLENGTVDDISNNLVHLVVLPADRTWDQFFFFVKSLGQPRQLVEADFLETVASVKSRLLLDSDERPSDSQIKLVYKWDHLQDEMPFDDEQVDVSVGCTFDLFVEQAAQAETVPILIKSTCTESFVSQADLGETTEQFMARIEDQQRLAAASLILMNLSGTNNGQLEAEKTLAEQGVTAQSVLALDVRAGFPYTLRVRLSEEQGAEVIEMPYSFNDSVEKLAKAIAERVQLGSSDGVALLFKGRVLEEDFKVYQYGIRIGDTLTLRVGR